MVLRSPGSQDIPERSRHIARLTREVIKDGEAVSSVHEKTKESPGEKSPGLSYCQKGLVRFSHIETRGEAQTLYAKTQMCVCQEFGNHVVAATCEPGKTMEWQPVRSYQSKSIGRFAETIGAHRGWLAALVFVNLVDMATTALGLLLGIPEGNPFQASLLANYGELAMFGSKIALVAILVLVVHLLRSRYDRLWPFFLAMTIPTALVVANNLATIARALG